MKVLVFAGMKALVTSYHRINVMFFNKWCKEMSSLFIYMAKYCFAVLLVELHPLKVALTNLSQFSRLSPKALSHYEPAFIFRIGGGVCREC